MPKFGASYTISLDYKPDEPDDPAQADQERGHLCIDCRGDLREFIEYAG